MISCAVSGEMTVAQGRSSDRWADGPVGTSQRRSARGGRAATVGVAGGYRSGPAGPFTEWQGYPGVYRAERGQADVGENEPVHLVFAGLLGDLQARRARRPLARTGSGGPGQGRFQRTSGPLRPPRRGRPGIPVPRRRTRQGCAAGPPGGVASVGDRVRLRMGPGSLSRRYPHSAVACGLRPALATRGAARSGRR